MGLCRHCRSEADTRTVERGPVFPGLVRALGALLGGEPGPESHLDPGETCSRCGWTRE